MHFRRKSMHAAGRALTVAMLAMTALVHCYAQPTISPTDITHTTDPNDPTGTGSSANAGFTIQPSVDGGKCLQVQSAPGDMAVNAATCDGTSAQRWVYSGGHLKNVQTSQCLDVAGSDAIDANATITVQACDNGRKAQTWIADRGIFYVDTGSAQFSLAVNVNPPVEATTLKLGPVNFNDAGQKWSLDVATPDGTGQATKGFHIAPASTPTACLDTDAKGNLVTNPCSDANSQQWTWLVTGLLQSGDTCISLPANPAGGVQPVTASCDATVTAQLWISTGGEFVNNSMSKCAEATGGSNANGAVKVNDCNGAAAQQWIFGAPQ